MNEYLIKLLERTLSDVNDSIRQEETYHGAPDQQLFYAREWLEHKLAWLRKNASLTIADEGDVS